MPSTAVEWAHWEGGVLSIKFKGGQAYDYLDVPEETCRELQSAASKGRFANLIIKPNYRFLKRRER